MIRRRGSADASVIDPDPHRPDVPIARQSPLDPEPSSGRAPNRAGISERESDQWVESEWPYDPAVVLSLPSNGLIRPTNFAADDGRGGVVG